MDPLRTMINELENDSSNSRSPKDADDDDDVVETIPLDTWADKIDDQGELQQYHSSRVVAEGEVVFESASRFEHRSDAKDARRTRDRHRKRNMSWEQKERAKEQALQRRAAMTEEDLIRRRTQDRERKRLKCLDVDYRKELYGSSSSLAQNVPDVLCATEAAKIRRLNMSPESLARVRRLDRERKRKEYKMSTAGTGLSRFLCEELGVAYPAPAALREDEQPRMDLDAGDPASAALPLAAGSLWLGTS